MVQTYVLIDWLIGRSVCNSSTSVVQSPASSSTRRPTLLMMPIMTTMMILVVTMATRRRQPQNQLIGYSQHMTSMSVRPSLTIIVTSLRRSSSDHNVDAACSARCCALAPAAPDIDRYNSAGRYTSLLLSIDGTDRQTDRQTEHRTVT